MVLLLDQIPSRLLSSSKVSSACLTRMNKGSCRWVSTQLSMFRYAPHFFTSGLLPSNASPSDYQRAQSIRPHRTRHICKQEIRLRRRNRNRYRPNDCLEDQHPHTTYLRGCLFRSRHSRGPTPPTRLTRSHSIRYPLSTCMWADAITRYNNRKELC